MLKDIQRFSISLSTLYVQEHGMGSRFQRIEFAQQIGSNKREELKLPFTFQEI